MLGRKYFIFVFIGVFVSEEFAIRGESSKKSLWPIKFPVKLSDTGKTIYYSIEKLHPSKYDDAAVFAAQHLKMNTSSPKMCWREELEKNISVVIFKPGTQTIIGLNILDIRESMCKSNFVCDRIFDKFPVDKYLTSEALAVDPNYRRHGLGEALLRVHVTICLEQHVDVTASLFISDSSNRLADRLNYKCLDRMSSESLAEMKRDDPEKFNDCTEITCKYLTYNDVKPKAFCTIM
ncbi:uncharacterized protein LOC116347117 [Contarinia nasturtii]|uniref:uncharacterized protein LOC116347117 n=1 Tax=Contarinia nasturtii TaxID=265458 RepID=UPI0012D3EABF|nr:uncharacterized protein LOC116347117 [Contarinia nasturtii]